MLTRPGRTSSLLVLGLLSVSPARADERYPRGDLLIEAAELARATDVRLLDARSRAKYDAGHLPGAVWLDHDAWSKKFAASQDPKTWADVIGQLGLTADAKIVVYDDSLQKSAARAWWILRYFGARDVRLLNGGMKAWPGPLAKEPTTLPPATFQPTVVRDRFADKAKVDDILRDKSAQIIDTRSDAEFCGDEKHAKRGGAIPGAIHLEWTEALDPTTQRFKSPDELRKILKDAGIDAAKPAVAHCQTGGRASVMAFTLELMGMRGVRNYYRGWSEWGNDDATAIMVTPRKK